MTAQCIDVPADEVDAFISEKMTAGPLFWYNSRRNHWDK